MSNEELRNEIAKELYEYLNGIDIVMGSNHQAEIFNKVISIAKG